MRADGPHCGALVALRPALRIGVVCGQLRPSSESVPMLNPQAILDAARRAAGAASCPAEVLLFGSYARGDADAGSDLDLMVIEEHVDDKTAEYLKIHRAVGSMGVGVDIVVISREDFERRRQVPGTVPYWAAKEGRRIHDARA